MGYLKVYKRPSLFYCIAYKVFIADLVKTNLKREKVKRILKH